MAKATAKKLLQEIVCRYGVPEVIESDRGTHFTGEDLQTIMKDVGINQAFHTPYHPQSSGKVERLNGTLKLKIQKAMAETGKPWTECLPITTHNTEKDQAYEIFFGTVSRTGCYFPQQHQHNHGNLTSYVIELCKTLSNIHSRVYSSLPDPDAVTGTHTLQPGDWVYLKKYVRKSLEPRFEGPYLVQLTTPTSVKLEGRSTWVHASHCKKALVPEGTT